MRLAEEPPHGPLSKISPVMHGLHVDCVGIALRDYPTILATCLP